MYLTKIKIEKTQKIFFQADTTIKLFGALPVGLKVYGKTVALFILCRKSFILNEREKKIFF
jgi:hypothetical protein